MTLKNAVVGSVVTINKIEYSLKSIVKRLYDLGIKQNSVLEIIRSGDKRSCMIVLVGGRLVALSDEITRSILCENVSKVQGEGGINE